MAARRGRKKELSESNLLLLSAVQRVASIQKGTGLTERQTHCRFSNGYVMATNDIEMIGIPVTGLAIECCPHSKTLVAALERCEGDITFTLEGSVLTVKSGRVRVPVPCLAGESLADLAPDQRQGDAGPALAVALGQAAAVVLETATNPMCRAVFMGPGTVEGIHDAKVMIQLWHGVSPLPQLAMPKETAMNVSKHPSKLVALGVSQGSVTFWFEDNSYLRSCLYDVKRPDFDKILECRVNVKPTPIDETLFEAVAMILPFSKVILNDGYSEAVTFEDGKVWAGGHAHDDVASFDYVCSALNNATVNGNYLIMFKSLASEVIYDEFNKKIYLNGGNMRSVIMGMRKRGE